MKHTLLLLFPFFLLAQTYTFSGAHYNVAQIIASKILQKAYSRAGIKTKSVFQQAEYSLHSSNSGETDGELAGIEKSLLFILILFRSL